MLERVRVEVGAELTIEDTEDVAVESCRNAPRVVVRGHQAVAILDEVDTEQEPVLRGERRIQVEQEAAALQGIEIADRAAEKGEQPAVRRRNAIKVTTEITNDGVDVKPRIRRGDVGRRGPKGRLTDIERNKPL